MTNATDLTSAATDLWKAQQKVKRMEAKIKPFKEEAGRLEAGLLAAMLEAKAESIASKQATVSIKRTQFAELTDDKAFFAFVQKNKAWDLVRKQPVVAACRARWEDDVTIPGVRPGTRVDLSVTTRSRSK